MNDIYVNVLQTYLLKETNLFKKRAYSNAINVIKSFNEPITNITQLRGMACIGKSIYNKLHNIKLEDYDENYCFDFTRIYGIGPKKCDKLYRQGIYTLEDLKDNSIELLNKNQEIGFQYLEEIEERIPRNDIKLFENFIEKCIDKSLFKIVGSYRRKKNTSGDIDILITGERYNYILLLECLKANGYITYIFTKGDKKSMLLCNIRNKYRRVDILYTPLEEYPFALLYFTGSKDFNTYIRRIALSLGYTMNEHSIKNKRTNVVIEKRIKTEKDIFKFLNLKYIKPVDR